MLLAQADANPTNSVRSKQLLNSRKRSFISKRLQRRPSQCSAVHDIYTSSKLSDMKCSLLSLPSLRPCGTWGWHSSRGLVWCHWWQCCHYRKQAGPCMPSVQVPTPCWNMGKTKQCNKEEYISIIYVLYNFNISFIRSIDSFLFYSKNIYIYIYYRTISFLDLPGSIVDFAFALARFFPGKGFNLKNLENVRTQSVNSWILANMLKRLANPLRSRFSFCLGMKGPSLAVDAEEGTADLPCSCDAYGSQLLESKKEQAPKSTQEVKTIKNPEVNGWVDALLVSKSSAKLPEF